jgi:hypothetical protein
MQMQQQSTMTDEFVRRAVLEKRLKYPVMVVLVSSNAEVFVCRYDGPNLIRTDLCEYRRAKDFAFPIHLMLTDSRASHLAVVDPDELAPRWAEKTDLIWT